MRIRESRSSDLGAVVRLLAAASLPTEGVAGNFGDFLIAECRSVVVGAIGAEVYGVDALLRSAVVSANHRSTGLGSMLCTEIVTRMRERGVKRVVLLTTTAEAYFAKRGFRRVDIRSITGPIAGSSEFTGACPASAVCMERLL